MSKPFKMLGHELPGPNQRTSLKMLGQEMTRNVQSNLHHTKSGDKLVDILTENRGLGDIASGIPDMKRNQPIVEDDTVETFAGGVDGGHGPTSKKKVDVEVTVNGQKV